MPALQTQPETITLEQYETLPEDKRVEVFDGVIYDVASPSQIHQAVSIQLSTIINNYILRNKGTCSIFNAPFDVKLSDNPLIIVQPDIMVVCNKDKLDKKDVMEHLILLLKSYLLAIHRMIIFENFIIIRIMEYVNIGL